MCPRRITICSKVLRGQEVGGEIDNSHLDRAITDDLVPSEYPLEPLTANRLTGQKQGTVILFEGFNEGIRHSLAFLKKTMALYFRFSLIDKSFNIFLNDEKVGIDSLDDLAMRTEFLWTVNDIDDPYVDRLQRVFTSDRNESRSLTPKGKVRGFIASVAKPRNLKITTTEERAGVDLFVNGRLRERDILKHIPTARVVESYLYGQIHCNELDDNVDRFTSSRESIVADDPKFRTLLDLLRERIINVVMNDWDSWRRKHREEGDSENTSIITRKERKAEELYNVVSEEYSLPKDGAERRRVDQWVRDLNDDAKFNLASYAECFVSENLVRKFIEERKVPLSKEANTEVEHWRTKEQESRERGNVNIGLRRRSSRLSYLSMDGLANLVNRKNPLKEACLRRDACEYKPIRDAVHTLRC